MPCGGIYPIKGSWVDEFGGKNALCFYCTSPCGENDLWVEEWDAPLHRSCLAEFLSTDEGKVVIEHGHDIIQTSEEVPGL